jgi:hypothetical protein
VREPFPSTTSGTNIIHGEIEVKTPFEIVSFIPQNGVIFSDGVEEDRLEFNSGATATIKISDRTLRLVVPANHGSDAVTLAPGQWWHEARATSRSPNSPRRSAREEH